MGENGLATSLLVIGGGPGGYPAAFHAADLGMEVTLVDTEPDPGGVCLYRGCIPSKALLHAAGILSAAQEASRFGIAFKPPQVDLATLRGWKESVVATLTRGVGFLAKKRNIRFIQGRCRLTGPRTAVIETPAGDLLKISFQTAVIATGSSPLMLAGQPRSERIIDSAGALALREVPRRLLVIGGGYIGLEMGQVYAALGSAVSVAEMTDSLLPGCDPDLAAVLEKRLNRVFKAILLRSKAVGMEERSDGINVRFEDGGGAVSEARFDTVLVAVGRRPNSEGIGLEHTAVKTDAQGSIQTDGQRRTAEPSLFAVGDVAGQPMLAHKATAEAKVAVDACAGKNVSFNPRAIPAVVFTDPEVAWCGLQEHEARDRGVDITVCSYPWSASGRALTLARREGLTKLLFDAADGRLLGAAVVGCGAGACIAEAALAVEKGCTAEEIAHTIHAHPTLSETIMEAAEMFGGRAMHFLS